MMGGVPPGTCWAIKKHWNNKFYYTVASCRFFLWDKVEIVNCPRKKLGFHKSAVTESTEQIVWLRKLSLGVKQIAARFKSKWLDPAVSCSRCVITLQWTFISTTLQTGVFRIIVHKSYTESYIEMSTANCEHDREVKEMLRH
jgi:hypothetical protein